MSRHSNANRWACKGKLTDLDYLCPSIGQNSVFPQRKNPHLLYFVAPSKNRWGCLTQVLAQQFLVEPDQNPADHHEDDREREPADSEE